jgi:hypothetical protein
MMAHWYCQECKQTRPEAKMLTGWNGPWCPNCVLDEVTLISVSMPRSAVREPLSAVGPGQ